MKKLNFIILAASLIGMTACGGNGGGKGDDTPTWSAAEKALLNTYAYGEDVPYVHLEGNEEMYYDGQYSCLTVTGGQATAAELAAYATVLDSYGYVGGYVEDNLIYDFIAEVTTDEGARYIELQFYCLDADDEIAESGTFWLDIYDPYYYDWDDMGLEDYFEYFSVAVTGTVPAFTDGDYYVLTLDYLAYGIADIIFIDVVGANPSTSEAAYSTILQAAGWTVQYAATEGVYVALAPSGPLALNFSYDAELDALTIMVGVVEDNNGGGDEGVVFPTSAIASFLADVLGVTGVTVPSLPSSLGAIFSTLIFVDDDTYGDLFWVGCADDGVIGVDSLEDVYKELVEAAGWINTNDEEYTYEDYGYYYDDPDYNVELQFYTFEGEFQIFISPSPFN